ncbi:hypothetical protein QBC35DRAFT_2503 [Podospora australis]|uniref:Uncharacterized protein n=1 Tax=Podospora australis TaxID=1536484 RepID=A0AAN6X5Y9_9PEZI|nr:hypothetical protein QBC35DRAFT_2503 [Podospora australis]
MSRIAIRRGLMTSALYRQPSLLLGPTIGFGAVRAASSIANQDFWKGLVPKFLRPKPENPFADPNKKLAKKGWNPATFFIFIFLFIGSMAVQMIALKKDFEAFDRQSSVRIGLLKEVVGKLQRGEEVDVEKVLGTGDPERERAWQEVLNDIQREEAMIKKEKRKQQQQKEAAEAAEAKSTETPAPGRTPARPAISSHGFF